MTLIRIAGGAGALLCALVASAQADAAVSLTGAGYTQNFDSLVSTGTGTAYTTLPTGWEIVETGGGARDNEAYAVGTGSSNTGDVYSFGAAGSSDRALGSLTSGSLEAMYGALFTNNTGSTITSITLDYFGEQWRRGSTPDGDLLAFEYSLDATSVGDAAATWVSVSALDFASLVSSPAGALDGDTIRAQITGTIAGLSIAQGSGFAIRWTDRDLTGSDDALAIDDLKLTTTGAVSAVPEPATWGMMVIGFGVLGASMRRRRSTSVRFA